MDRIAASAAAAVAGSGAASTVAAITSGLIGAPSTIHVGDVMLGKHVAVELPIFNLDPELEATMEARVIGSPALRVVGAPLRLRPSREGFDPSRLIQLEFRPTSAGRIHASIEVVMGWPMASRPPQTLTIRVVGGAHAPSDPTLDEQDAEALALANKKREDASHAAEQTKIDADIKAEYERDTDYHKGHLRQLEDATKEAETALTLLYNSRFASLEHARGRIGTFVRQQSPREVDLLAELAYFALDVASAGIAGGIAKRLEPTLKYVFGQTHIISHTMGSGESYEVGRHRVDAGPGLVSLIADGVKHVTKEGGKLAKTALKGGNQRSAHESITTDVRDDFIHAQQQGLAEDTAKRANSVAIRTKNFLLPTLKTQPGKAVDAMNRITAGLSEETPQAGMEQLDQTLRQWVRLVAGTSLGVIHDNDAQKRGMKTGGLESVTDIRGANQAGDDHQPLARVDGLVDVSFVADHAHPERAVRVTGVTIRGVRDAVARAFEGKLPSGLGLPVRASGLLGGPGVSITVVRDEAGNVAFTDNSSVEWEQATWLARKAGVQTSGTPADQQRGARKLIEEEIMSQPLSNVETDSAG